MFRHKAEVEALLVGMIGDSSPALGEGFGVTILTTRAYLGASPDRVPGCVCPFDGASEFLVESGEFLKSPKKKLKICCPQGRAGSSPASGISFILKSYAIQYSRQIERDSCLEL
jgi:hypothetical protein